MEKLNSYEDIKGTTGKRVVGTGAGVAQIEFTCPLIYLIGKSVDVDWNLEDVWQ